MATRKAWKDLTPAYKARLQRAGVTSRTHGVVNLVRARGHQLARPPGAAPEELVNRQVRHQLTYEEMKGLASKFTRPDWIPAKYPIDVAAALSQLPNPKTWESVEFIPRADDEPWTMIVKLKGNAYDREILIPGGGGPATGARSTLELVTDLMNKSEDKAAKNRRLSAMFFEVLGSDEDEA